MTDSPGIELHAFQHKVCDTLVEYQVTRMSGQTMIWVGTGEAKLSNLSAAVPVQVRQITLNLCIFTKHILPGRASPAPPSSASRSSPATSPADWPRS